jgi:hypothetical protein
MDLGEAEVDKRGENGYICPACGSSDIACCYSFPPSYQCNGCRQWLFDENGPKGIPVLGEEEARKKRPGLYGDPACDRCNHAVHEGSCDICAQETIKRSTPHIYKFKVRQYGDPA